MSIKILLISLYLASGSALYMGIKLWRLKKYLKEHENNEEKLRYYSEYDMLSGLRNRNSFIRLARKMPLEYDTVLVCDINNLKIINDTLGHLIGDQVIRIAADILKKSCPAESYIFRMGGDEFLALLKSEPYSEETCKIHEAIGVLLDRHNQENSNTPISLSIGISRKQTNEDSLSDVIK
jgi:diguanylate cyclase (GGDEF)-like protein